MKAVLSFVLVLMLAACGSTPQQPISYEKNHFANEKSTVGIYFDTLPVVDTHLPGAGCLLCYAAAAAANSSLTKHFKTLSAEDLEMLHDDVVKALEAQNVNVKKIDFNINFEKLKKFKTKELNFAERDFRSLKDSLGIDKLIVIDLNTVGAVRSYSGYIPNGAPTGSVSGVVFTVDLTTNKLELYQTIEQHIAVQGEWDEAPAFPGVTNSYYQAIEQTKEQVTGIFK